MQRMRLPGFVTQGPLLRFPPRLCTPCLVVFTYSFKSICCFWFGFWRDNLYQLIFKNYFISRRNLSITGRNGNLGSHPSPAGYTGSEHRPLSWFPGDPQRRKGERQVCRIHCPWPRLAHCPSRRIVRMGKPHWVLRRGMFLHSVTGPGATQSHQVWDVSLP